MLDKAKIGIKNLSFPKFPTFLIKIGDSISKIIKFLIKTDQSFEH